MNHSVLKIAYKHVRGFGNKSPLVLCGDTTESGDLYIAKDDGYTVLIKNVTAVSVNKFYVIVNTYENTAYIIRKCSGEILESNNNIGRMAKRNIYNDSITIVTFEEDWNFENLIYILSNKKESHVITKVRATTFMYSHTADAFRFVDITNKAKMVDNKGNIVDLIDYLHADGYKVKETNCGMELIKKHGNQWMVNIANQFGFIERRYICKYPIDLSEFT